MTDFMSETNSSLFAGIAAEDRKAMLGCIGYHIASFRKGEIIAFEQEHIRHVGVVLSGSVFKGRPAIPQQVIAKILAEHAPKAVMLEAVYEPVVGAAAMGLQHIGEEGWKQRLAESAQKLKLLRGRKDG